jgi:adenosylcobinamide-phosphate synthase
VTVAPWQLLAGISLDLLLGDPRWLPHPVRGVGWLASRLERFWRSTGLPLRTAGVCFWSSVVAPAAAVVWMMPDWMAVYWIWSLLALRGLDIEATKVIHYLAAGDLAAARWQLSMIVGRDTAVLQEPEILRAAIETVAENFNDAVVAPLFWLAVAGPAGMAAYKAINTLDSMVGYKNERYAEFGWASARLDDAAGFIPARISAALVWLAAALLRLDAVRSFRATLRDGRSQPSPNAGYPEAAFAGALRIRLGGMNFYGGVPSPKPYLGEPVRGITADVFSEARAILYASAFLMIALMLGVTAW